MNEISARLNEISLTKNIPLTATLELTYLCPFKCIHCYIPYARRKNAIWKQKELKTEEWKQSLREIKKAGCLYIVFTGGEPLLRNDLGELCRYAVKLNLSVKVFTTGFNLKDEFLRRIKNLPISFELSLYGRERIHNMITGDGKSFQTTLKSARLLKKSGFGVKLKMPLMKQNFKDAEYIKELAQRYNFTYAFDPIITLSGSNKKILKYRLTDRQLTKILSDKRLGLFPEINKKRTDHHLNFICGAGRNTFAINPYGEIFPCLEIPKILGNVKKNKFVSVWRENKWLLWWRNLTMKDVKVCSRCSLSDFCNRCPGIALMEDGDLMGPSTLACQTAKIIKTLSSNL